MACCSHARARAECTRNPTTFAFTRTMSLHYVRGACLAASHHTTSCHALPWHGGQWDFSIYACQCTACMVENVALRLYSSRLVQLKACAA